MHYVYVLQPIRKYCTINAKSIIIHHALKVCLKVYIKCQTIYIYIYVYSLITTHWAPEVKYFSVYKVHKSHIW